MHFRPIFSALMRSPVGLILICLQVALTLAIIANSLQIVKTRMDGTQITAGIDEDNIFSFYSVGFTDGFDSEATTRQDLDYLNQYPGVLSAMSTNTLPFTNSGWSSSFGADQSQESNEINVAVYFSDETLIDSLGLKLIAGRSFSKEEIGIYHRNDNLNMPSVIISDVAATNLYPDISSPEEALGKQLWMGSDETRRGAKIIGIVSDIKTPWKNWGNNAHAIFIPFIAINGNSQRYVVRTKPGQMESVMKRIQDDMGNLNTERMAYRPRTFNEYRADYFRDDVTMMSVLSVVIILLLLINALGIIGLVSFWINQRTKQIGTRRALGASKQDILRYFLAENLIMSGMGVLIGMLLAMAVNNWLVTEFSLPKLPALYLISGALLLMLLGILATYLPARRAANIPPAIATRSA